MELETHFIELIGTLGGIIRCPTPTCSQIKYNNARKFLSPAIMDSPATSCISVNPVAQTFMVNALKRVLECDRQADGPSVDESKLISFCDVILGILYQCIHNIENRLFRTIINHDHARTMQAEVTM